MRDDEKNEKVARLLLSSDNPGEVMAARDALLRLLKGDRAQQARRLVQVLSGAAPETFGERARYCLDRQGELNDREFEFLDKIQTQAHLTPRQGAWINRIFNRIRSREAQGVRLS